MADENCSGIEIQDFPGIPLFFENSNLTEEVNDTGVGNYYYYYEVRS